MENLNKRKIKLKYYRNLKGFNTQEKMAEALGMSITSYTLKENGIREFTENEIRKLLLLLDVKYEDIFLLPAKQNVEKIHINEKTKQNVEER